MGSFLRRWDWAHHLGLLLLIGIILFAPLLEGGTTHLAAMILRLLILSALCVYLIMVLARRTVCIPRTAVGMSVVLFLGLAMGSTLFSPYVSQSVQWLTVCIGYAGLFYLFIAVAERWEDLIRLRSALCWMACAQAIWAMIQQAQQQIERPSGTFFNPNFLAGYLAVASVFILAALVYSKINLRMRSANIFNQEGLRIAGYGCILVFLLATLLQTGSRGGAAALVTGVAMVIVLRFGRRGLIGLCALLIVTIVVPNPIRDRVVAEHARNPMAYSRWHMWEGAVQEIIEHPLGHGLGLYQYVYPRHAFPIEDGIVRYGRTAYTPHNEYLQIGVELGIPGLIIFLWGILQVGREAVRLLRKRLRRGQRGLAVGFCAGTGVILVQAVVDSNLHEPGLAVLLALCVGGIVVARSFDEEELGAGWALSIRRPVLWVGVGTVVVGLMAVHVIRVGMAYQRYEAGMQWLRQGQYETAVRHLQNAISLDPGKAFYHNSLAGVYFQRYQRTHDEATALASIQELHTAGALNPLDGRLQGLLAQTAAERAAFYRRSGATMEAQRWLSQAVEAYERAMALEPFAYIYRAELGQLMLVMGRLDAAEQHWEKVLELEPNYLPARESLAQLYVQSGRRDRAQQEYAEIVARRNQFASRAVDPREQSFMKADLVRLQQLLAGEASTT